MNAENAVQRAVMTALRTVAGLNGVYPGPAAPKPTPPYAELGDVLSVDWGVKDRAGRELRIAVSLRDAAETPERVHTLAAAAAAAAIEALTGVREGWQVVSVVPVRSRLSGGAPGRWAVTIEYRVRALAA